MTEAMIRVLQKAGVTPGDWTISTTGVRNGSADVVVGNPRSSNCKFITQYSRDIDVCFIFKVSELIESLIEQLMAMHHPVYECPADIDLIQSALNLTWEEIQEAWNG